MDKVLKFLALAFAVFFVLSTVVQYNDPDRSIWIFIYLVATGMSVSAYFGKFDKNIILAIAVSSLFGAFDLFPYGHFEGVALKHGMKTLEIELARESFGMAIIFAASALCLFMSFRKTASA